MKIGILTFHRAYNYGAFLQSFALSSELIKLGYNVEIIDYMPLTLMNGYRPIKVIEKNGIETKHPSIYFIKNIIFKILNYDYIVKKNSFDKIRNKYIWMDMDKIPVSSENTISDSVDELKKIADNCYDMIIVGSDAVWNDFQTNCPYIYYLDNIECRYKVSYAASAYGMSYEKKSQQQLKRISKNLDMFNLISCRDEYTEREVSKLTNQKVYHTCDPTLFLNMSIFDEYAGAAKKKLLDAGVDFQKKLIFLMGDRNIGRLLKKLVKNDYMLVGIYNYNQYADVNVPTLTPFEWVASFRYFEFTVTSYFHCSIFSMLNHVPVIGIDKLTAFSIKHKSKLEDLFERLGVKDTYFTSNIEAEEFAKAIKIVNKRKFDLKWIEALDLAIINEKKTGKQFLKMISDLEYSEINNEL